MLKKILNYIDWGVYDLNEIIEDKELFNWFYCGDDFDI